MSRLRNSYELKLIRESGRIASCALRRAMGEIRVGVSGLEVDKAVEQEIVSEYKDEKRE